MMTSWSFGKVSWKGYCSNNTVSNRPLTLNNIIKSDLVATMLYEAYNISDDWNNNIYNLWAKALLENI